MNVIDTSAILAFLQDEAGAQVVEAALPNAVVGAANWSEVAQKIMARGGDWSVAEALLSSYEVRIEPVMAEDAVRAAQLRIPRAGLSLGDRLCLALAARLGVPALTADRTWGESDRVTQVR